MEQGDLVRCWSVDKDQYNKIGIVLEHNLLLKTVEVFFQESGEVKTLYSRDVQLLKRCPNNVRKILTKIKEKQKDKKKLDNNT
jgi:hypothetical protein